MYSLISYKDMFIHFIANGISLHSNYKINAWALMAVSVVLLQCEDLIWHEAWHFSLVSQGPFLIVCLPLWLQRHIHKWQMGGWRNDWMDGNAVLWIANGNKKLKSLKNEKIISVSIIKLDRPYIFWVYFAISPSNF